MGQSWPRRFDLGKLIYGLAGITATVWIVERRDDTPRLVTAYPLKE